MHLMTQTLLQQIAAGSMPDAVKVVARDEGLDTDLLRERVAAGRVVIPMNTRRSFHPRGIGEGLTTKVNANIGTSPHHCCLDEEVQKLEASLDAKADSVMDLSTGGDLEAIRREILQRSPVMVGTVPIYALAARLEAEGRALTEIAEDEIFDAIEAQCRSGVDYITVHCGITRRSFAALRSQERTLGIVSRGGSLLAAWMVAHERENPLYASYDRLLGIAREHDVTLSLGDSLRPGSVVDATDRGQIEELITLGELALRARRAGVQAIIEGPGHVPLDQIADHVRLQKRLCEGAPFYLLGPLTTDRAAGYDHIAAAIGGAIAAAAGADFLCYVTPAEHLKLPDADDVREGVVAARIAAHSGDIVKGAGRARELDRQISEARARLDWEGMLAACIDPVTARRKREASEAADEPVCTMCGRLCAVHTYNEMVKAPATAGGGER
jgi:phosphomethylpyrimidine synthase